MSRVLIIGAGGVGNVVVKKCAQHPKVFTEIWHASRTKSKCDAIAAEVRGAKSFRAVETDGAARAAAMLAELI